MAPLSGSGARSAGAHRAVWWAGFLGVALTLGLAPAHHASEAQGMSGSGGVVALLDVAAAAAGQSAFGSGFFIGSDGTVLTNAHVVLGFLRDPGRYRLIALWNGEWFSASVTCASALPAYQTLDDTQPVHPRRDIAEVRLGPAPAGQVVQVQGRQWRPHTGPLPAFPALAFAGRDPVAGQQVETLGYTFSVGPPTLMTQPGRVLSLFKASDGTPIVALRYATPAQQGESGAPILDTSGYVVGMQTWKSASKPHDGAGIAQSALKTPCQ
ncbi:MAG TPA: serine protease [bacterium]|nr:serine protease [bacterium]